MDYICFSGGASKKNSLDDPSHGVESKSNPFSHRDGAGADEYM